jgi:pimeloyl-ACP methyl ester carboxylesterase
MTTENLFREASLFRVFTRVSVIAIVALFPVFVRAVPVVLTQDAQEITDTTAGLGCVVVGDTLVQPSFEIVWGRDNLLDNTFIPPYTFGTVQAYGILDVLVPDTTYAYQCVVRDQGVTYNGTINTFTTPAAPVLKNITICGRTIVAGDVVYGEECTSGTGLSHVTFSFFWPYAVQNSSTLFILARGDIGAFEDGIPAQGMNVVSAIQAWGAGENTVLKYVGSAGYEHNHVVFLEDTNTQPSPYIAIVVEREYPFDTDTDDDIITWFASGGVSGTAPARYATLRFTYGGFHRADTPPALAYADSDGYENDTVLAGRGVEPNKGVADKDALTFNTVYTDVDGDTPAYVRLWVKDANGVDTFYDMTPDASAPATLSDADMTNGEAYTYTGVFSKGVYTYAFLTADTHDGQQGDEVSFPAPLSSDPSANPLSFTTGYSSVAFLPGIGGSRLYTNYRVYNEGEMVWEPNDLADVSEIRLDKATHESNDPSIVVSGITDEIFLRLDAWPTTNVYKTFMQFMDEQVVGQGIIIAWKPLAYDWRLGLDALVSRGKLIGTMEGVDIVSYGPDTAGTDDPYLIEELRALADASDTGKVSVVTHSNGGLLAKEILKRLEDTGDPLLDRIDTVVMVAAPQLGTPEAVATLLHGTTKVGKGLERDTAETLPSAYHLLPSQEYFHTVSTPVLEFDPDVTTIPELVDFAGRTIGGWDGYASLKDFLTGHAGTWTEPTDIDAPNVLDASLLAYAESVHNTLDTWTPPVHIRMVQIAGWGIDTIRGIGYDDWDMLFARQTLETLDRHLLKTTLGDGTVVLPSAIAMHDEAGVETYYVNLPEYNNLPKLHRNRKHSGILEVDDIQKFLKNIFTRIDLLPSYISTTQPTYTKESKTLRFIMHSPVAMHLYDTEGNHTGIIPNPDPASDIRLYEENISNSFYEEWGEVTYIGADASAPLTLRLTGEDVGTFTLEVEETHGDTQTGYTVFSDIPVVKGSTGTITVTSVSDVGVLTFDNNGDGSPDVYAFTDEMKETIDYDILKEAISGISSNQKSILLKQVDAMEKLHNRGNVIAEKALLLAFKKQLETLTNPRLPAKMRVSESEQTKIEAVINTLLEHLSDAVAQKRLRGKEILAKIKEKILKDMWR